MVSPQSIRRQDYRGRSRPRSGIGLFSWQSWARILGIAAGVLGIIINFFYLFAFPWSALVGIFLASLVVYGLSVYGDDEATV